MTEPTCDLCGGPMVREAVLRNETYWVCKGNPNPNGPTRYLSPLLKEQRKHHDKSSRTTSINKEVR